MNGEENNDEVEDGYIAKEEKTESRSQNENEEHLPELLQDVDECKSKPRGWMNKIPVKNQFLKPINKESRSIKRAKNDIVNNLAGEHLHDIFEQYVNTELKLRILEETNR